MASHKVFVEFNASIPVANTDLAVTVRRNGRKLGTLLISQGSIKWQPSGHSVNIPELSWREFAELMKNAQK